MIRSQILVLCIMLISTLAVAEDSVDLPMQWKTGEKMHYEIIKTRQIKQSDKVTDKNITRTDIEIEIFTASDKGYLIGWTYGETRFDDPHLAANPVVQQMGNLLKGLQIILELDSKTAIVGVRNWKEITELSQISSRSSGEV